MSHRKAKKRKVEADNELYISNGKQDTSKPTAAYKPTKGRQHTLSIALPGSIIANALTHDQKNALAGQIARACAVFCVDEVVIFDDGQAETRSPEEGGYTAFADPNYFLYHVLTYLETPPHLRKALFPMHPDLRTAGSLPSLDMPHHLRSNDICQYREGVTVRSTKGAKEGSSTLVDCGLRRHISLPIPLEDNTRVTVKLPEAAYKDGDSSLDTEAVSPDMPREEAGYYWGYSVRQASSLSGVFTECPYDGGYSISIGTSERGIAANHLFDHQSNFYIKPDWQRLLIVFGGISGLEAALDADQELLSAGVEEVQSLFDRWINLVPGQGSRTVRTEESIWVGLTALRALIDERNTT